MITQLDDNNTIVIAENLHEVFHIAVSYSETLPTKPRRCRVQGIIVFIIILLYDLVF